MSVVRNDQADSFVKSPPPQIRSFLVHGLDEGLIHERSRLLLNSLGGKTTNALEVIRLDGDNMVRDPGRLLDEAYAISLFGSRRALWIEAGGRDLATIFEPLIKSPPADCVVVVEAGNLKKGAALRSLFEGAPQAASIECYPDEKRSLAGLIESEASLAEVDIEPDAKQYLISLLGSDRLSTRGELAKLFLFAKGKERVDVVDVQSIVSDAGPATIDAVIDFAFLGEIAEAETACRRFFEDGGDGQYLLARLIARCSLLYSVTLAIEQGRTFDSALQSQFVRLSPSGRSALQKQAERWSSAGITRRLPALLGVSARSRRQARLGEEIATRALWAIASGARGGSRRN